MPVPSQELDFQHHMSWSYFLCWVSWGERWLFFLLLFCLYFIVLSVFLLLFIFWPLYCLYFYCCLSFSHCIVFSSIVLSVLLLYYLYFYCCWSFGHCIVCTSIVVYLLAIVLSVLLLSFVFSPLYYLYFIVFYNRSTDNTIEEKTIQWLKDKQQ
jgi:phosphate/sulfate permease